MRWPLPNGNIQEETGVAVDGDFISLGEVKQAGGKVVKAWGREARNWTCLS